MLFISIIYYTGLTMEETKSTPALDAHYEKYSYLLTKDNFYIMQGTTH